MTRSLLILSLALIASLSHGQQISSVSEFFSEADEFFAQNVSNGRVDYAGIKKSPDQLKNLVDFMSDFNPSGSLEEVRIAFWINAYNITTIKSIVEKYPISSPLDDADFFTGETHKVGGELITLSDIEKKKLIKPFKDERFHFVLVCAANGCPPLASFAYRPEKIEQQIKQRTRVALNSDGFIRVNIKSGEVLVSQIFNWYEADFKATGKNTIEYINQYREVNLPASAKVGTYEYDWTLNEDEKKK